MYFSKDSILLLPVADSKISYLRLTDYSQKVGKELVTKSIGYSYNTKGTTIKGTTEMRKTFIMSLFVNLERKKYVNTHIQH